MKSDYLGMFSKGSWMVALVFLWITHIGIRRS